MSDDNKPLPPAVQLVQLVEAERPNFLKLATHGAVKFEQEAEFALQILCKDKYFMDMALNNKQAVRDAISQVGAIGISLNPALKLAYLAPRDKKIQLLISYMGLAKIAMSSGSVKLVKAELVYANDGFRLNGVDKEPVHEFSPFSAPGARGELVGVYCVAKTLHDDFVTDWMTIEDVYRIRDRSESWKAHVASKSGGGKVKSSPWLTDPEEMIKKTVIKRAYKMWPAGDGRLFDAVDMLNKSGEGIEFGENGKETPADFSLSHFLEDIESARTPEELTAARRAGQQAASRSQDKASYDKITQAAQDKKRQFANQSSNVTDVQEKKRS